MEDPHQIFQETFLKLVLVLITVRIVGYSVQMKLEQLITRSMQERIFPVEFPHYRQ